MSPNCPRSKRISGPTRLYFLAICVATIAIVAPAPVRSEDWLDGFRALFGIRPVPDVLLRMRAPVAPGLPIIVAPSRYPDGPESIVSYCVKLCDGSYFPLPLLSGLARQTPMERCTALCPASRTRIYVGAGIERASATNGSRYADLDTAFTYRKELVSGCTCNGSDVFGTAAIDIATDPTLRNGDIVMTKTGLHVFKGAFRKVHLAEDFRPIGHDTKPADGLQTKMKQ